MRKLFFCLVLVGACGSDDGPVDGVWTLTETTCDGAAGQFPPYTIDIRDDVGVFTLTFAADCVASFDEVYNYGDNTIEIDPQSVTCEPNAGCEAAIGASCPALPPAVTYAYVQSGDTLEFSKASVGPPADPCPAGQEVKFVMTR